MMDLDKTPQWAMAGTPVGFDKGSGSREAPSLQQAHGGPVRGKQAWQLPPSASYIAAKARSRGTGAGWKLQFPLKWSLCIVDAIKSSH